MLTKKRYSTIEMMKWSRWELLGFTLFSLGLTVLYEIFDFTFLHLPWTPIALIGTAVAFVVGFQNNSAYDRIWEARKIWGGIVNTSRTFGLKVTTMVENQDIEHKIDDKALHGIKKVLIYRHIAWITALRHAMREPRKWEVWREAQTNREWADLIHIPEVVSSLEDELSPYLSEEDMASVLKKNNKATTLLYMQAEHLRSLKNKGLLWEFSFLELENVLEELFTLQGQSERIKNFPYPRQYATLSHLFVWIFLILLPFGIVPEFNKIGMNFTSNFPIIGNAFVWLAIPFCSIVSWVFYTMERIGRVGENPFEGSSNDVPISTIARGIEIDIRQQLGETLDEIPKPFPEKFDVQM